MLKLIPYEMQASEAMAETKKLIESAKPGDEIGILSANDDKINKKSRRLDEEKNEV